VEWRNSLDVNGTAGVTSRVCAMDADEWCISDQRRNGKQGDHLPLPVPSAREGNLRENVQNIGTRRTSNSGEGIRCCQQGSQQKSGGKVLKKKAEAELGSGEWIVQAMPRVVEQGGAEDPWKRERLKPERKGLRQFKEEHRRAPGR